MSAFARTLIAWQKTSGRQDLPWQSTTDPYRIWVSEIMLQQTQVSTVIPYFERFLARFPDVEALARAPVDDVLGFWSGLGYYARGRNLHRAAQKIVTELGGHFPKTLDAWMDMPGVGRSTAAAILAFSMGAREAILDGNVKRVLCRAFGIEGFPGESKIERRLWDLAESLLPDAEMGIYTQALMDLGATLCVRGRPRCEQCPLQKDCIALASQRVETLPTPRPKKIRPMKASTFWWVENDQGQIWLDRRPEKGIWGGLWCCLSERPLGDVELIGEPQTVQHELTHFSWQLTIEPIAVSGVPILSREGRWFSRSELPSLGLPAPIRELLGLWGTPTRGEAMRES